MEPFEAALSRAQQLGDAQVAELSQLGPTDPDLDRLLGAPGPGATSDLDTPSGLGAARVRPLA